MRNSEPDHYAVLGLDHRCTADQIRMAYRLLAKRHHPDVNHGSAGAVAQTQAINAAYEILSDPKKRRAYDDARKATKAVPRAQRSSRAAQNLTQDVHLKIEEFLRGTTLDVKVHDPGNVDGPEIYQLVIPPETAPGARFRIPRTENHTGGFVVVRLRALPGFRFKVRGSDLRCDLRINVRRVSQGGYELIPGANGSSVKVPIPVGVARGEVVRIFGEGLPKPRGGRGDLLVRIMYQPAIKISRHTGR